MRYVLAIAVLASVSCAKKSGGVAEFPLPAASFELLWVAPVTETATIEGGPKQLPPPDSLPTGMSPGYAYGFRKDSDITNTFLALDTLPAELRRIGAQVTKAPRSREDLTNGYVGGPFFRIEFELGGHDGALFNRLVRGTVEGSPGEEIFVLIYR